MCDESWSEQAKKGQEKLCFCVFVRDETWNKQWVKRWLNKVGMSKRAWKRGFKDLKCLMRMFRSLEDLGLKEKGGKEC